MDTSGQKNGGGRVEVRGSPKAGSVPRTRLRLPRTGRRDRDASDAVLVVLHATSRGRAGARHGGHRKRGSPVSRRAPPRRGPRAAPPGTKPVGSAVARFRLGTRVRDPPYRYKPHMSSRRAKTRRLSLIASTPGRELTGGGAPARDTTRRLSSPTRLRGRPERAESRETRKRPENGQAHRRRVAMGLVRGGDCFPTSQEGCGGLSPHLTLPSLRGPPRSRLNRAPLPL